MTIARLVCFLSVAAGSCELCMANAGIRGSGIKEDNIEVEERLLWRNETPIDGEQPQKPVNNFRPGLLSNTLSNSNYELPSKSGDLKLVFKDQTSSSIEVNDEIEAEDKEEQDPNSIVQAQLNEGPSHGENGKQDCLWRVLTGTSCTSLANGNIVNAEQHEYVVADGECRYNDFLGYYRAGCQPPSEENENTFPGLAPTKAKVVLQYVFCADEACSIGCHENAMIRSKALYTSNFCYLSNDDEESAKDKAEQRINSGFSFEFVGGCLESENCNVVVE